MSTIKAKKNLYNKGKCFTKGRCYEVRDIENTAALMDMQVTNDLGEPHIIGVWWRDFIKVK